MCLFKNSNIRPKSKAEVQSITGQRTKVTHYRIQYLGYESEWDVTFQIFLMQ